MMAYCDTVSIWVIQGKGSQPFIYQSYNTDHMVMYVEKTNKTDNK